MTCLSAFLLYLGLIVNCIIADRRGGAGVYQDPQNVIPNMNGPLHLLVSYKLGEEQGKHAEKGKFWIK